jgi:hypothetical protein
MTVCHVFLLHGHEYTYNYTCLRAVLTVCTVCTQYVPVVLTHIYFEIKRDYRSPDRFQTDDKNLKIKAKEWTRLVSKFLGAPLVLY